MYGKKLRLPKMNPKIVAREIEDFIINSVLDVNSTGGVIGLSGGVDSTIAAALAQRGFKRYNAEFSNSNKLELVGYILPSSTNQTKDTEDGINVAKKLGIKCEVLAIDEIVNAFRFTNPESLKDKYHKGNLMSRIRANILNTKSATEKKTLIGTGNKDEDFGIGYYTLFGDGAVHISPIGNLPKRLVKEMAIYLGFPEVAKRIPTAGLEPGQTDFGDLGYSYESVEAVIEAKTEIVYMCAEGLMSCTYEMIQEDVKNIAEDETIEKLLSDDLKISKKFNSVEDAVKDILRRHYKIALPKADLLHPKAAEITLNYD
jgi:NAD+ synthase